MTLELEHRLRELSKKKKPTESKSEKPPNFIYTGSLFGTMCSCTFSLFDIICFCIEYLTLVATVQNSEVKNILCGHICRIRKQSS